MILIGVLLVAALGAGAASLYREFYSPRAFVLHYLELLEEREPAVVVETARDLDLAGARRWFTSFGCCSVQEPLEDLLAYGLLAAS